MFKSKTVFVIGAGASAEYNLPVGSALKDNISDLFRRTISAYRDGRDFTPSMDAIIRKTGGSNKVFPALEMMRNALPLAPSIDNYIYTHNSNSTIVDAGKIGIIDGILAAEGNCKLTPKNPSGVDFSTVGGTWLAEVWKMLVTDRTTENVYEIFENVAFICFNYDRCIEHFFYNGLQAYFGLTPKDALTVMETLQIFHPYGSVGSIQPGRPNSVAFGSSATLETIFLLLNEIKTFTERVDEGDSKLHRARASVRDCKHLVFLGFAFHPINMDLILPAMVQTNGLPLPRVFASVLGLSPANQAQLASDLSFRFTLDQSDFEFNGGKYIGFTPMRVKSEISVNEIKAGPLIDYHRFTLQS